MATLERTRPVAEAKSRQVRRVGRKPKAPHPMQGVGVRGRVHPRRAGKAALVPAKLKVNPKPENRVRAGFDQLLLAATIGSRAAPRRMSPIWVSSEAAVAARSQQRRVGKESVKTGVF